MGRQYDRGMAVMSLIPAWEVYIGARVVRILRQGFFFLFVSCSERVEQLAGPLSARDSTELICRRWYSSE